MANAKVYLEADSIQSQVKTAVREVMADAEHVRLVVQSVEAEAAEKRSASASTESNSCTAATASSSSGSAAT